MGTNWKPSSNKTKLTFLLSLIFLFLFSIATPVFAEELYLKCDGTRFGDDVWKNITFIKIYPEKGRALFQDQFDDRYTGWLMFKIIRFEEELIHIGQCETPDCFKYVNNHYIIDRVTGRMKSGSFVKEENGNEKFEKHTSKTLWFW